MTTWIRPLEAHRARLWQRLTGNECLPVTTTAPILMRLSQRGLTPAYVLDCSELHEMAIKRIAGWLARRNGLSYQEAESMIRDGWIIPANNCEIETADPLGSAVLFFFLAQAKNRLTPSNASFYLARCNPRVT